MTEYIVKSHSGRDVFSFQDETRARQRIAEAARQGIRLRLFKISRIEEELAA